MERSMFNSLLLPDLRVMFDEDDGPGLKEFCKALHPGVVAEVLEGLDAESAWQVLTQWGIIFEDGLNHPMPAGAASRAML